MQRLRNHVSRPPLNPSIHFLLIAIFGHTAVYLAQDGSSLERALEWPQEKLSQQYKENLRVASQSEQVSICACVQKSSFCFKVTWPALLTTHHAEICCFLLLTLYESPFWCKNDIFCLSNCSIFGIFNSFK